MGTRREVLLEIVGLGFFGRGESARRGAGSLRSSALKLAVHLDETRALPRGRQLHRPGWSSNNHVWHVAGADDLYVVVTGRHEKELHVGF
jgi:hypothetical protein